VVAERLLIAIDAARLHTERGDLGITVSIGVCRRLPETADLNALIERAGEALHQAKNAGRNQVVSI
jgi:PleD family two-component response regulator